MELIIQGMVSPEEVLGIREVVLGLVQNITVRVDKLALVD